MTDGTIGNLGDIPDLSGVEETEFTPFADGWYSGTILEQRSFTDNNGNDRIFTSEDVPSQNGSSRNIRLQLELKRADGRTLNLNSQTNYQPEDLTQESVQAIMAETERIKETKEKRKNFRGFMALTRLGALQRIAGVRQLQRNGNGGLDLTPLYGKTAYFRIGPDDRSEGKYKEVKQFSHEAPKKAKVL